MCLFEYLTLHTPRLVSEAKFIYLDPLGSSPYKSIHSIPVSQNPLGRAVRSLDCSLVNNGPVRD